MRVAVSGRDGWVLGGSLVLPLLLQPMTDTLSYNRSAILAGEWWRLVTGHLVHTSGYHLALNLAGFASLYLLFLRRTLPVRWLGCFLVISLLLGLCLLLGMPQLEWYMGLSGVLYGLLSYVLLCRVLQGEPGALSLLLALGGLLILEEAVGTTPFSQQLLTAPVITTAHLLGAVCGLLVELSTLAMEGVVSNHDLKALSRDQIRQ